MNIELGCIVIYNTKSFAAARVKIRNALVKLGETEITATRAEAILSDIFRVAINAGREVKIGFTLCEHNGVPGMAARIEPFYFDMREVITDDVLEHAQISECNKENQRLCLFKAFEDKELVLDESLIESIRKGLAHLSREELMDEISRKNEELNKSQQLLNAVLENIGSAVYAKDMDGRYIYVNHIWENETGKNREEILGLKTLDIFPGELGKKYLREDEQVLESRTIIKCEDKLSSSTGEAAYYLKTGVPMMQGGTIIGLCGMTTDITDRKKMEEELITAKTIAEVAAKSKADFLANMSHEIRTPMNAIVGMTFLLNNTQMTAKQKDYAVKIQRSSQHLLGIINDILDFSKIEAGKLNIEETEFRLHVVLENLYNMIGEKCSDKGLELIFDIDPNISDYLQGDPLRLGQVLVNYTNNAVKFTEKGEIIVRIHKVAQDGDQCTIRFEVQDSGIGLKDEQKAMLFKPFHQADTSTTRKYGGTGLGLAISRQLATLMGGEVGVESTYGVGSTFWFTARLRERKKKKERVHSNIDIKERRVLVVDDNSIARKVLQEILISLKLRADEADSGKTALQMIQDADAAGDPYEVIYMDMQMPFLTGVQTWEKVLSMKLRHKPACMIVTAYGREEVFHEAEGAGIEQVLIKPTTPSTLLESTYQILGGCVIHDEEEADEGKEQEEIKPTPVENMKILLVEDNELNQQVAVELLDGPGVEIDVADNGQIALDMVGKKQYNVVLMDMQMPVMDGYEATRRIRENPQFESLPILAMTANAMEEDRRRCINAGMNDFITKPIEPAQLYTTLKKWAMDIVPPKALQEKQEGKSKEEQSADIDISAIHIPGLNVQLGLNRILGKKDSYFKILRKFADAQKMAITEIETALRADDRHTAERIAHTLKGLAGNIGAESLQEKAAALELVIRENLPEKTLKTTLNETRSMLSFLIQELERLLPAEPAAPTPEGPVSDDETLRDILLRLQPSVRSRKPKQCAALLKEFNTLVWPDELKADAAALAKMISKYKYREALDKVGSLLDAMGGAQ